MNRLESRLSRLEGAQPAGASTPCAVVRYNPGTAAGWLPGMIAQLGWSPSSHVLVTIDASGAVGDEPQVILAPASPEMMTPNQSAILVQAGARSGPWWIAVAGRGWADGVRMEDGEPALLSELRAQRRREQKGWAHGL